MTGEEMERAIEFILQNQATYDERLEQTQQQIAETSRIMRMHAETQTEFIKIVTKAVGDLAEVQRRSDDRVDRLAATVERFISEGRDGRV